MNSNMLYLNYQNKLPIKLVVSKLVIAMCSLNLNASLLQCKYMMPQMVNQAMLYSQKSILVKPVIGRSIVEKSITANFDTEEFDIENPNVGELSIEEFNAKKPIIAKFRAEKPSIYAKVRKDKNGILKFKEPAQVLLSENDISEHIEMISQIESSSTEYEYNHTNIRNLNKIFAKYPAILNIQICFFDELNPSEYYKIDALACAIKHNLLITTAESFMPRTLSAHNKLKPNITLVYQRKKDQMQSFTPAITHFANPKWEEIFELEDNVALIFLGENYLELKKKDLFQIKISENDKEKIKEANKLVPNISGMPILDSTGCLIGLKTNCGDNIFTQSLQEFLSTGLEQYHEQNFYIAYNEFT